MQAKDQLDRIPPMAISGQPGAAAPNPPDDEIILKTKVFLSFGDSKTGLSARRASAGKAGNLSDVAKKAGITNKPGISSARKLSTFPAKIER
jgi:hypothetical protein